MKTLILTLSLMGVSGVSSMAFADESMGEKAEVKAKDAKRSMKKTGHRVEEKACLKDDAACLKDKAKHRTEEAKDASKDKASEIKNDIDK